MDASRRRKLCAAFLLLVGLTTMASPVAAQEPGTKPQGVHTLYLVRHGDYDENDPRDPEVGKALNALGRQQAELVGQRLAGLPMKFEALYTSTMTRARETAAIVATVLPYLKPDPIRDLRECTPPLRPEDMHDLRPGEADSCRAQLETAFGRFFKPSPAADRRDILVCHGNVIRYFCMRALGVDPQAWNHMTIANCSLTVIQVRADGTLRLVSYDDVGHIPVMLQTYTGQKRAAPDTLRR